MNQLALIVTIVGIFSLMGVLSVLDSNEALVGGSLSAEGESWSRKLGFDNDKLRVAVFGGSNAWGTGPKNRFKAYPYLLSRTVDNFAHSSMGPNYFSVCTESVVGDDSVYDVIIIDYWLRYFEGLDELARRLRQRYPHAIMIFVRTWSPVHFKRKSSEDSHDIQSLGQWKNSMGLNDANIQSFNQAIADDTGYWFLPDRNKADSAIRNIVESVKGYEFTFTQRETGKQTLIDFMGYFDAHSHAHTSELGHKAIAHAIDVIIHTHVEKGQEVDLVNSGVHGHWGRGDSCHMWYFSGGTNMLYSENMHMEEFDSRDGHFALAVEGPSWFVIDNKLDDEALPSRTLYLNYLTSQTEGVYPDLQLSFGGQTWTLHTHNTADFHHPMRTVALGQLPHGETNITVTPVGAGNLPFRLAGYEFSNEIAVPLEWGFGPSQGGHP